MRWIFFATLVFVHFNNVLSIDGQRMVRVHSHQEQATVRIYQITKVALAQIVHDTSFIQMR